MLQTRGQQTRDHSPIDVSGGTLRGITAEGDTVSKTVYSGSTLKNAAAILSTNTSTNASRSMCVEKDSPAPCQGGGSPTLGISVHENE